MLFRKGIAGFIIATLLFSLFPRDMWALSNAIVSPENYPGKMDTRNISGLGKNISNDFFAGAMTFQYPVAFPSGSRGMTPELSLSYSSNNSDAFSPYGYGFSLSIPRVQRSVKKGVSELYTQDEFVFGGQDLIRIKDRTNQFKSKDMSDTSLYTRTASGGWTVTLPDGKIKMFGTLASSRVADPSDPTHIYAWLLDEERDLFGHAIQYQYALDGGQPYLSLIQYGYTANGSDPMYQIRFDYIPKAASLTSYRTQFEVSTKKLLSKITLLVGGAEVRGYQFGYDTPDSPISHLTSIGELGAGGEKLPNISFSYGDGQYQHMVTEVDNHRGGKAVFQYAPSTGYRTLSGDLQNQALPFVVQTLAKQILIDTVTGINSTETYSYGSGHYYYDSSDIWGREYVGFARVGIRDDKAEKTLYFHQSQTSTPDLLKYQDHIAKKGRLYQTDTRDIVSGNMLSRELVRYDMRTSENRWLVFPVYKISSLFDSDMSHRDTAVSYVVDDMGNTLRETHYGWVSADLEKGTYTDMGGDTVTTDRTYVANPVANLYGFLSTEKMLGFSGEVMSSMMIEYDNTSTGITLGLLTAKIRDNISTNQRVRETTGYSLRGLPIKKIDPLGNMTTYNYDDRDIALKNETNPLGWNVEYTYSYPIGKPTITRNQNGVMTTVDYDIWGREISRSRVIDGSEELLTTHTYDDLSIPNINTETNYFTTDGDSKTSYQYTDGWGRTVMTTTSTENIGQYSTSQIRYDSHGNPIYAGYPIFTPTNTWNKAFVFSGVTIGEVYRNKFPGVSYTYDATDRIVSQRDARGITQKSYTSNSETITNALGFTTRGILDAYGNLISFIESTGGRDLTTSYTYDALSRPLGLRDTLGNIRNWEYDGLGRLGRATDTHTSGDTAYGVRQYEYDILGRLMVYTTAKGEKISYIYDTLSRLKRESYPTSGSGTWSRDYSYDQGSRSLGTLSTVSDPSTTVAYTYDPLGRKTGEARTIGSKGYPISYGYNIASSLTSIVYPDGGKTDYTYKRGYIEGVDYTDPVGNQTHLITDISYAPNSTMQSIQYGNGVLKNTTRDPDHNYRLTRSTTTLSGSTLLDTEYRYDAISNIDRIRENGIEPVRKSIDYTYDALSRLTRADYVYSIPGYNRTSTPYSYTYDDIGNIASASSVGSYGYSGLGYATPHAVTTAGDTTYGYDQAGQTTSRTSPGMILAFAYSPYGEMISSQKNGEVTNYAYDQTRRRVLKSTLGLTEHHITGEYEVEYESGALVSVSMDTASGGILANTGSTLSGATNTGITSSGFTSAGKTTTVTSSGLTSSGNIAPTTNSGAIRASSGITSTGTTSSGVTSSGTTASGTLISGSGTMSSSTGISTTMSSGATSPKATSTGSVSSGSISTGSTSTGALSVGSGSLTNTRSVQSGSPTTLTGIVLGSTGTQTPITNSSTGSRNTSTTGTGLQTSTGVSSPNTSIVSSGMTTSNTGLIASSSYMIIAGYVASTLSGATPITLTTTLTHIMLGDERIATFQTQTDDTEKTADDDKLIYHIADHLNSSSLDLSSTGIVLQATDYLPFGQSNTYEVATKRIKGKKRGYTNKYVFANKQLDSESDLQYFEKRYYDNRIGRFTTEDPVYWEVGRTKRPESYFTDPQQWNSYSYVRNNPVNMVDPTGESPTDDISNMLWEVYNAGYTNVMNDLKSETKSYQQAITTIAQNAPGIGDIGDAYALATGKDLYSGEDISGINRAITAVAFIIPGVSGSELRVAKHAGFSKQVESMTAKQLNKSAQSFEKNIVKHENLVKDPVKYLTEYGKPNNWDNLTKNAQQGLINHWKSEIVNFKEQLKIVTNRISSLTSSGKK